MSFDPSGGGMSAEQYDKAIKKLEAAGVGNPTGRLYHVCFGEANNLKVIDVWDTVENFQKFGNTLMPILQQLSVDPGQPQIDATRNIIKG